jgi:hypothetical protein
MMGHHPSTWVAPATGVRQTPESHCLWMRSPLADSCVRCSCSAHVSYASGWQFCQTVVPSIQAAASSSRADSLKRNVPSIQAASMVFRMAYVSEL